MGKYYHFPVSKKFRKILPKERNYEILFAIKLISIIILCFTGRNFLLFTLQLVKNLKIYLVHKIVSVRMSRIFILWCKISGHLNIYFLYTLLSFYICMFARSIDRKFVYWWQLFCVGQYLIFWYKKQNKKDRNIWKIFRMINIVVKWILDQWKDFKFWLHNI